MIIITFIIRESTAMSYNRLPTFIPIDPPPSAPSWKDRILDGLKLAGRAVGAIAESWPSKSNPSPSTLQSRITYTPTYNWNLPIPEPDPVVYDNGQ